MALIQAHGQNEAKVGMDIVLLRDANSDGVPEVCSKFLTGLNSPLGVALVGNDLCVANPMQSSVILTTPARLELPRPVPR